MKKQRPVYLEKGSVEKYRNKHGILPPNFVSLLIEKYKAGLIKPVYKKIPRENMHKHGLTIDDEEMIFLKKEGLKRGIKVSSEGAAGMIRTLINGDIEVQE